MQIVKKIGKVISTILVCVIFMLFVVSSSVALGFVYTRYVGTNPGGNTNNSKENDNKESINVLVLGVNQYLSDFMVVARYNPANGKISILSIPRDTKYATPNTSYSKINAIYQGKHIDKITNQVEKMLDISIDKYVVFDNKALWEVVDAIGGVTVDVGNKALKYSDPEQDLNIDLKPGVQKLDGKQAEQYVRFRKGYYNGDIGRIHAQQNFIKAFIEECMKPTNMFKLPNVAKTALDNVQTDIDLNLILYYLEDVAKFDTSKIEIQTLPGTDSTLDGVSFYIMDKEKTKVLVDEMFKDIVASEGDVE